MSKLDRRIAVEVMGEPEPEPASNSFVEDAQIDSHDDILYYSDGGNWHLWYVGGRGTFGWVPNAFSTNLDQAMKAAEKLKPKIGGSIYLNYNFGLQEWWAWDADSFGRGWDKAARGDSAPEAICCLLIALKESSDEKSA